MKSNSQFLFVYEKSIKHRRLQFTPLARSILKPKSSYTPNH
nr:MAG TPA: hypothetical protein [Caudoviricetes sp.]